MPVYSVTIGPAALQDLNRLKSNSTPENREELDRCVRALMAILRYDPERQGRGAGALPNLRAFACGPLRVFYRVSPPEDRYAAVIGVGWNADWVW